MKNNFVLIKLPGHAADGRKLTARAAALKLLEANFWPIFNRTRNKKIMKPGDSVAVYLGGQYNQIVIATAIIEKIDIWGKQYQKNYPLTMDGIPESVLILGCINLLQQPVDVTEILDQLSFIPFNSRKWGVAFMGGARKVSDIDFKALTRSTVSNGEVRFKKTKFGTCKYCGCTDNDCSQCIKRTGEACYWVDANHTVCSACR